MSNTVTEYYLSGIREGRATLRAMPGNGLTRADIPDILRNVIDTCRLFDASNPVGQMLRGERDFWKLQARKAIEESKT